MPFHLTSYSFTSHSYQHHDIDGVYHRDQTAAFAIPTALTLSYFGSDLCGHILPRATFVGAVVLMSYLTESITSTTFYQRAFGEADLDEPSADECLTNTPDAVRRVSPSRQIGPARASIALLKAYIGPAVLYLPLAWRQAGWLFATAMLPCVVLSGGMCVWRLVDSRPAGSKHPSYGDIMESCTGPVGRRVVNASIVLLQSGTCCTYFIFNARMVKNTLLPSVDVFYLIGAQIFILAPLSWIRQVSRLAITSLLADALIFISLVFVLVVEGQAVQTSSADLHNLFNPVGALVCLGSQVFAMEGIALVLPIHDSLRKPHQFPCMLIGCLIVIMCVFAVNGLCGYMAYGYDVQDIVLLNMVHQPCGKFLQVAYALAVVFTYPLQLLPAIKLVEVCLFQPRVEVVTLTQKVQKSAFRTLYCLILAVIAVLGATAFEHFVSIIGAVCGIPLAFVYPCICHYTTTQSAIQKIVDVSLAVVGLLLMLAIAAVNVQLWIESVK